MTQVKSRRRGAGEGSITQRPDGRWHAKLDLGWRDGKRVRQSYYGRTAREARQKRDAAKVKQALGTLTPGRALSLKAFLSGWLEDTAAPRLKVSTLIRYREIVHRHLIPGLGHVAVDKLSIQQVQHFLNERQKAGSSPRTTHHMRAVLRTALNYAIRARLVTYNVAALAESPKIPDREPTFLKADQTRAFMDAAAEDRMSALFMVALGLGLRQGEALGLGWKNVDLDGKLLHVRHSARRVRPVKGEPTVLMVTAPKTKASLRTLPMPDFVVEALRHHRERQLFERRAAGDGWQETGFVFTNRDGSAFEAKQVGPVFRDLLLRAGLPPMRFHDLRHSCATFLLASGVPPRTVMSVMGHSTLATTMQIYAHTSAAMLVDASDTMQRILAR